jgi:hypothetical protein
MVLTGLICVSCRLQDALCAAVEVERSLWEAELHDEFLSRAAGSQPAPAAQPVAGGVPPEQHRDKRLRLEEQADSLEDDGRFAEADTVRAEARKLVAPVAAPSISADNYVRTIVGVRTADDEAAAWLREPELAFSDCEDVFAWWARNAVRFPTVARLVKVYLIIPATSIDIERLFSKLQFLVDPTRTALSAKRIRQVLTINDSIASFPSALDHYAKLPPAREDE